MAQILTPNSDQATGAWVTTPLWSKVDDDSTANPTGDGVEITSDDNTAQDIADFGLTNGTDPAVATGHILRARWHRSQAGNHNLDGTLELWEGVPGTGTLRATLQSAQPLETTEVEDTYTLSAGEANAITDYTNLFLRLYCNSGTGGSPGGREALIVDLIELELPDAAAPEPEVNLEEVTETDTPQELTATTELSISLEEVTTTVTAGEMVPETAAPEPEVALEEVTTTVTAAELELSTILSISLEEVTETDTPQELTALTEVVVEVEQAGTTITPAEMVLTTEPKVDVEEVTETDTPQDHQPETAAGTPEVLLGVVTETTTPADLTATTEVLLELEQAGTTITAGEMVIEVEGGAVEVNLEEVTTTVTAGELEPITELSITLEEVNHFENAAEMVIEVGAGPAWFTPEPITLTPSPITYTPIT